MICEWSLTTEAPCTAPAVMSLVWVGKWGITHHYCRRHYAEVVARLREDGRRVVYDRAELYD